MIRKTGSRRAQRRNARSTPLSPRISSTGSTLSRVSDLQTRSPSHQGPSSFSTFSRRVASSSSPSGRNHKASNASHFQSYLKHRYQVNPREFVSFDDATLPISTVHPRMVLSNASLAGNNDAVVQKFDWNIPREVVPSLAYAVADEMSHRVRNILHIDPSQRDFRNTIKAFTDVTQRAEPYVGFIRLLSESSPSLDVRQAAHIANAVASAKMKEAIETNRDLHHSLLRFVADSDLARLSRYDKALVSHVVNDILQYKGYSRLVEPFGTIAIHSPAKQRPAPQPESHTMSTEATQGLTRDTASMPPAPLGPQEEDPYKASRLIKFDDIQPFLREILSLEDELYKSTGYSHGDKDGLDGGLDELTPMDYIEPSRDDHDLPQAQSETTRTTPAPTDGDLISRLHELDQLTDRLHQLVNAFDMVFDQDLDEISHQELLTVPAPLVSGIPRDELRRVFKVNQFGYYVFTNSPEQYEVVMKYCHSDVVRYRYYCLYHYHANTLHLDHGKSSIDSPDVSNRYIAFLDLAIQLRSRISHLQSLNNLEFQRALTFIAREPNSSPGVGDTDAVADAAMTPNATLSYLDTQSPLTILQSTKKINEFLSKLHLGMKNLHQEDYNRMLFFKHANAHHKDRKFTIQADLNAYYSHLTSEEREAYHAFLTSEPYLNRIDPWEEAYYGKFIRQHEETVSIPQLFAKYHQLEQSWVRDMAAYEQRMEKELANVYDDQVIKEKRITDPPPTRPSIPLTVQQRVSLVPYMDSQIQEYLTLPVILHQMFYIFEVLFNVRIEQVMPNNTMSGLDSAKSQFNSMAKYAFGDPDSPDLDIATPFWHNDILYYRVYNANKDTPEDSDEIGQFYLDLFPADHKGEDHSTQLLYSVNNQITLPNGKVLSRPKDAFNTLFNVPIAVVTTSISQSNRQPMSSAPFDPNRTQSVAYDEVVTLFHEFSHALTLLLSQSHYHSRLSAANALPDYLEISAHIGELIATDPEIVYHMLNHKRFVHKNADIHSPIHSYSSAHPFDLTSPFSMDRSCLNDIVIDNGDLHQTVDSMVYNTGGGALAYGRTRGNVGAVYEKDQKAMKPPRSLFEHVLYHHNQSRVKEIQQTYTSALLDFKLHTLGAGDAPPTSVSPLSSQRTLDALMAIHTPTRMSDYEQEQQDKKNRSAFKSFLKTFTEKPPKKVPTLFDKLSSASEDPPGFLLPIDAETQINPVTEMATGAAEGRTPPSSSPLHSSPGVSPSSSSSPSPSSSLSLSNKIYHSIMADLKPQIFGQYHQSPHAMGSVRDIADHFPQFMDKQYAGLFYSYLFANAAAYDIYFSNLRHSDHDISRNNDGVKPVLHPAHRPKSPYISPSFIRTIHRIFNIPKSRELREKVFNYGVAVPPSVLLHRYLGREVDHAEFISRMGLPDEVRIPPPPRSLKFVSDKPTELH